MHSNKHTVWSTHCFPKELFTKALTVCTAVIRTVAGMQSLIPGAPYLLYQEPRGRLFPLKQYTNTAPKPNTSSFASPCLLKSGAQENMPLNLHFTASQPTARVTSALVLAVEAPLLSLKFVSSANSIWHYFNNPSHWVDRETFLHRFYFMLLYFSVKYLTIQLSHSFPSGQPQHMVLRVMS